MRTSPVGGVGAIGSGLFKAYCLPTDQVGDAVRILGDKVGGLFQVTRVNIVSTTLRECRPVGVIAKKLDNTACIVQWGGILENVYDGLTYNESIFVGLDGRLTMTPPPRPAIRWLVLNHMGVVLSNSSILIDIQEPVILRP